MVVLKRDGPTLVNGRPFEVEGAAPNPDDKVFPRVPSGQLLVLGDNRVNSCDSHQFVPSPWVPETSVLGRAKLDER
jgi:hypothetical protein